MRTCPNCYHINPDDARFCAECQGPVTAPAKAPKERSDNSKEVDHIRESTSKSGPNSWDLTDQQWYNVCKFYPSVAKRVSRPMVKVGPTEPLDPMSKLGPLLTSCTLPIDVREPGEEG